MIVTVNTYTCCHCKLSCSGVLFVCFFYYNFVVEIQGWQVNHTVAALYKTLLEYWYTHYVAHTNHVILINNNY